MSEYLKQQCPYCNSQGHYCFKFCSANYYKCSSCELIYKKSNKSYEEIILKYRKHYHNDYGATEINGERNKLYFEILKFLEQKIPIGKLLDVGTGCGFFLLYATEKGWKVSGIDPSVQSVEIAKNKNNLNVTVNTLKKFSSKSKFDLITFINVLDHSAEPWKEIERARKLLEPGGHIFIRSPNGFLHSHILTISSKFGFGDRISKLLVFHEYSFTYKYIKRLLKDYGFSNIIIQNSPPSIEPFDILSITNTLRSVIRRLIYFMSGIINVLSFRNLILGPSLWIIASKNSPFE